MAIIGMEKIRILLHRGGREEALEAIQKLGAVEFREVGEPDILTKEEKTNFEFNYASSRLDFAITFLSKYAKESMLKKVLEGGRIATSKENIEKLLESFSYNEIIDAVQNIEEKQNDLKAELASLHEEEILLLNWRDLPLPLNTSRETKRSCVFFITGKREVFEELEQELVLKRIPYECVAAGETSRALIALKEDREQIREHIGLRKLAIVNLPSREGTPQEELERISMAKKGAHKALEDENRKAKKLTIELPRLKMVADYMFWKKEKDDLLARSHGTEKTLVLEGWCPKNNIDTIQSTLHEITPFFFLETLPLEEGEEPPVEIANRGIIRPFETITRLYGMPGYNDLDPTLFLSGFFFIFFGLCLTDVVYGIFLAALIGIILLRYKVKKELKPLLMLLFWGGVASAIVGLFFGGYLGYDISIFPQWIQNLQYFNPITSPLPIFYLSLALGFFQIVVGLILKIASEAKNNRLKDGLLDQIPWLLFFAAIAFFVLNKAGLISGAPGLFTWPIYVSLLAIVISRGRSGKGILGKPFKGILGLYDSVGYFSDILSYSRLLALGLATSALAFSINLIAALVRDIVPVIGPLLMILVLVVGHLFNIIINVLGAFIHSARLQFVEFFGKFMSGSGKGFIPFQYTERFVALGADEKRGVRNMSKKE